MKTSIATLALLAAISVPSLARASSRTTPTNPGKNISLKGPQTVQSLSKQGEIGVAVGHALIFRTEEVGAVSQGIAKLVAEPSDAATITMQQVKAPPPGAIGWGGEVRYSVKVNTTESFTLKATNMAGQTADVTIAPLLNTGNANGSPK